MTSPTIEQMCRDLLDIASRDDEAIQILYDKPCVICMANKLQTIIEAYTAGYDLLQKLRPLVWGDAMKCVESESCFGVYEVHDSRWMLWCPDVAATIIRGECDSIHQGKQLCFADYQSRVRALFE